jgi:hypothetical protein
MKRNIKIVLETILIIVLNSFLAVGIHTYITNFLLKYSFYIPLLIFQGLWFYRIYIVGHESAHKKLFNHKEIETVKTPEAELKNLYVKNGDKEYLNKKYLLEVLSLSEGAENDKLRLNAISKLKAKDILNLSVSAKIGIINLEKDGQIILVNEIDGVIPNLTNVEMAALNISELEKMSAADRQIVLEAIFIKTQIDVNKSFGYYFKSAIEDSEKQKLAKVFSILSGKEININGQVVESAKILDANDPGNFEDPEVNKIVAENKKIKSEDNIKEDKENDPGYVKPKEEALENIPPKTPDVNDPGTTSEIPLPPTSQPTDPLGNPISVTEENPLGFNLDDLLRFTKGETENKVEILKIWETLKGLSRDKKMEVFSKLDADQKNTFMYFLPEKSLDIDTIDAIVGDYKKLSYVEVHNYTVSFSQNKVLTTEIVSKLLEHSSDKFDDSDIASIYGNKGIDYSVFTNEHFVKMVNGKSFRMFPFIYAVGGGKLNNAQIDILISKIVPTEGQENFKMVATSLSTLFSENEKVNLTQAQFDEILKKNNVTIDQIRNYKVLNTFVLTEELLKKHGLKIEAKEQSSEQKAPEPKPLEQETLKTPEQKPEEISKEELEKSLKEARRRLDLEKEKKENEKTQTAPQKAVPVPVPESDKKIAVGEREMKSIFTDSEQNYIRNEGKYANGNGIPESVGYFAKDGNVYKAMNRIMDDIGVDEKDRRAKIISNLYGKNAGTIANYIVAKRLGAGSYASWTNDAENGPSESNKKIFETLPKRFRDAYFDLQEKVKKGEDTRNHDFWKMIPDIGSKFKVDGKEIVFDLKNFDLINLATQNVNVPVLAENEKTVTFVNENGARQENIFIDKSKTVGDAYKDVVVSEEKLDVSKDINDRYRYANDLGKYFKFEKDVESSVEVTKKVLELFAGDNITTSYGYAYDFAENKTKEDLEIWSGKLFENLDAEIWKLASEDKDFAKIVESAYGTLDPRKIRSDKVFNLENFMKMLDFNVEVEFTENGKIERQGVRLLDHIKEKTKTELESLENEDEAEHVDDSKTESENEVDTTERNLNSNDYVQMRGALESQNFTQKVQKIFYKIYKIVKLG